MLNAFSWANNSARSVRFLKGSDVYLFLAQFEKVSLFLALPKKETERPFVPLGRRPDAFWFRCCYL